MSSISGHPVAMTVGGAVVTKAYFNGQLVFEKTAPLTDCLRFTCPASFKIAMNTTWDGTMQYSTDGTTWFDWTGSTVYAATDSSDGKYKLYFRGIGNTALKSAFDFTGSTNCTVDGNVMALLDYQTEEPTMGDSCFQGLFSGLARMESCDITLPSKTVPTKGYFNMFSGCTSLVKAPVIYAEVVKDQGLTNMFIACSSLTTVQDELYFTEVGDYGCMRMYNDCIALKTPPTFAHTMKTGTYALSQMYCGCFALTGDKRITMSFSSIGDACCQQMFMYCTELLHGADITCETNVSSSAFYSMYSNCSGLIDAGSMTLKNNNTGSQSFYGMYEYCTALERLPEFTGYKLNGIMMFFYMFKGCTALTEVWSFASLGQGVYSITAGDSTPSQLDFLYNDSNVQFSTTKTDEYPNKYQFTTFVSIGTKNVTVCPRSGFSMLATATVYTNATVITLNG